MKPDSLMRLTQKQESFCQHMLTAPSAAEAYRRAYEPQSMSENACRVEAARLNENPKIALRLKELRDRAAEGSVVTARRLDEETARIAFGEAVPFGLTYGNKLKALELLYRRQGLLTDKLIIDAGQLETEIGQRMAELGVKLSDEEKAAAVSEAQRIASGR